MTWPDQYRFFGAIFTQGLRKLAVVVLVVVLLVLASLKLAFKSSVAKKASNNFRISWQIYELLLYLTTRNSGKIDSNTSPVAKRGPTCLLVEQDWDLWCHPLPRKRFPGLDRRIFEPTESRLIFHNQKVQPKQQFLLYEWTNPSLVRSRNKEKKLKKRSHPWKPKFHKHTHSSWAKMNGFQDVSECRKKIGHWLTGP